jgi:uncharacterized membrane protein YsdA (DUF1294 family)
MDVLIRWAPAFIAVAVLSVWGFILMAMNRRDARAGRSRTPTEPAR